MNTEDKRKIFKLMCSDCWQLGVELFKTNNLDLDEFIEYAIHYSEYTRSYQEGINGVVYHRSTYVLGVFILVMVHHSSCINSDKIYINMFFNTFNIYHINTSDFFLNESIINHSLYLMNKRFKSIIYG